MTFLWVVVILMAVALAAEIFALVGLMLVVRRATRNAVAVKEELAEKFRCSVRFVEELKVFLRPHAEVVQRDGREIASTLAARTQSVKITLQDADRRVQRIRLRFQTDGIQTMEQLQSGRRVIEQGVVRPVLTVGRMVRAVSAAIWLLRKVA
jgi:hypothetical protein